jgi:hypothetical protein
VHERPIFIILLSKNAFDMHRTGAYIGRGSRHCLSAKEMRAKGCIARRKASGIAASSSSGLNRPNYGRKLPSEIWPKGL